ncbi:MAG: oxygenase MpaB family protein [Solirubrobacteraceae bacterium]
MTMTAGAELTATEQIPTEFAPYWDAIERPAVKRARAAARSVLGFDLVPDADRVREFAHGYYDADPIAEEFVDDVYLGRSVNEGRQMLDRAIALGVEAVSDAPESMVRLFEESERDPDWLDPERMLIGAKVFRRLGPSAFSLAGATTLLAYTENSIVKPLALTGAYAGDTALNRFMETARFWIDTTEPGGLDPGGQGRATAIRVRIMHVFIRRRLLKHPEWNLEAWGVPICQSEMTIPLLSSSLMTALGLKTIGHRTTRAEIDAMMHLWRYIGHIMGVQPRHFPENIREGIQLANMYMLKRDYQAGGDGRELIESYPRAFTPSTGTPWRKRIRDELNYRAQLGYTRFFLPPGFYGRYDMPQPWPWALHPLLQFPANFTASTLARRNRAVADRLDRYQRWRRETWWRNEMGDKQSHFQAAESFRR